VRRFLDSIPYWLANSGIGWHDGENSLKIIPKPDGQANLPAQVANFFWVVLFYMVSDICISIQGFPSNIIGINSFLSTISLRSWSIV